MLPRPHTPANCQPFVASPAPSEPYPVCSAIQTSHRLDAGGLQGCEWGSQKVLLDQGGIRAGGRVRGLERSFVLGMGGGSCPRYLGRVPRGEVQASSTLQWREALCMHFPQTLPPTSFSTFLQSGISIRGRMCVGPSDAHPTPNIEICWLSHTFLRKPRQTEADPLNKGYEKVLWASTMGLPLL